MEYRPRIVDKELARRLAATGAVVVEGPKACGKTATARQFAASEVLLDVDENARRAISIDRPDQNTLARSPRSTVSSSAIRLDISLWTVADNRW